MPPAYYSLSSSTTVHQTRRLFIKGVGTRGQFPSGSESSITFSSAAMRTNLSHAGVMENTVQRFKDLKDTNGQQDNGTSILHKVAQHTIDQVHLYTRYPCTT